MALAGGRFIGPGGAAGAVDGGGVDRRATRARHTGAVEGNPSVVRWPVITMGFGQFAHGGSAQSMQIHLGTVHIDLFDVCRAIGAGRCCLYIGRLIVWQRSVWTSHYCLLRRNPSRWSRLPCRYDNNYYSAYLHLQDFNVKEGQTVEKGDVIAYMGDSGYATGVYLYT